MTEIVMSKVFVARRQAWLSQLRTACDVLSEPRRHLVKSISVTQRFAGVSEDERYQLLSLATRLAGEYGLSAETTDSGTSITVWFTRPTTGPRLDAPATSEGCVSGSVKEGLLAKVIRRFRRAQQTSNGDRSETEEVLKDTEATTSEKAW